MIRPLTLSLSVTIVTTLCAQGGVLLLRGPGPLEGAIAKQAHAVVMELDPDARVSFHEDLMKLRSTRISSGQVLISSLTAEGLTGFSCVECPGAHLRSGEGYPVLIDTGDPDADARRHQAAKAAWIEAHPDAYRALTGEGPVPGKEAPVFDDPE